MQANDDAATRDEAASLRANPVKEISAGDTAVIVRLAGELDLYNAEDLRRALLGAVERPGPRVVVDLGEVGFVDSTALGVLIEARRRLANPRAFLLAAPRRQIRRTLEISGLDRHFAVHDSVDDALTAEIT